MSRYFIILINYNNYPDTIECIQSLKDSGVNPGDIIVVENGSENCSLEKLKDIQDIKLLDAGKNLGFSGGNNFGIDYALNSGCDYIILLNNDTLVSGSAISNLIYEMDRHPEASAGTGQIRCYPSRDEIWYAGGRLIPWRGLAVHRGMGEKHSWYSEDKTGYTEFISGCYLCLRTSDIGRLGKLNEQYFIYLEDIEYSAKAHKKGLKFLYIPQSVIYHKWRGETTLKYNTLYYAVRNRLLLIDNVFPVYAKYYFMAVMGLKSIYWYFTNHTLFNAAKRGLTDYMKKYFGQIRNI